MTPKEIFRALETTRLSPGGFSHRSHVQAAWWVLSKDGAQIGTPRFIAAIKGFIESVGAHDKYNETLTQAFLQIIAARVRSGETWEEFEARNPRLLHQAQELLAVHYSTARLDSEDARLNFLPPDLEPLPDPIPVPSRQTATSTRREFTT